MVVLHKAQSNFHKEKFSNAQVNIFTRGEDGEAGGGEGDTGRGQRLVG